MDPGIVSQRLIEEPCDLTNPVPLISLGGNALDLVVCYDSSGVVV